MRKLCRFFGKLQKGRPVEMRIECDLFVFRRGVDCALYDGSRLVRMYLINKLATFHYDSIV